MKVSILTLFPKMISGFFEESIVKRAQEQKLVDISLIDLRKFAVDDYGSVDDRPYGGGAGMIMRVDVIYEALHSVILGSVSDSRIVVQNNDSGPHYALRASRGEQAGMTKQMLKPNFAKATMGKQVQHDKNKQKIILTSPKGKVFNQQSAISYSKLDHLVIIAGHYEGIDERVRDFVDEEVSLGNFVMTGGEIVASAIADSVVRSIPGVLKKEEAIKQESFSTISIKHLIEIVGENNFLNKLKKKGIKEVKLLEYPHYTRPEDFFGKKAPDILLSGNHKEIEKWRLKKAFEETLKKRPDLLR